jgi:methylphosphotriester-DNA--protein-cysteine methyltransferase
MATASATPNTSTTRNAGDGNDLLDLREPEDNTQAERRRSNQLEKELRGLRQQLTRFSEINPEEYARLQEAERQKQLLEQQLELRERQMEEGRSQTRGCRQC